jgi:hypothetical protein
MRDFKLDESHDLDISNGDFHFVENGAEVAQHWLIRMLWIYGEWFANLAVGMPWFNRIFKLTASPVEKRELIIAATLETPGVKSIKSLEQTSTDRLGKLDLTIETDYDTIEDVGI